MRILIAANVILDVILQREPFYDDLEDCLQAESAALFGAEYVLTRNVKHFTTSPVPAITPKAFCEHMKSLKP